MTEKVKCALCGKEIAKKDSVLTFDITKSQAVSICTPCYYKELVKDYEGAEDCREEPDGADN